MCCKTDDSYIFRKFTLLVAIKNSKCVGWKLYEKGGITNERLVEFLEEFVFDKYKNHLIILDNAGSHRNNYVKDAITESENNYLFSVPYTPKTNVVEMLMIILYRVFILPMFVYGWILLFTNIPGL